jgi:hypothetical protein
MYRNSRKSATVLGIGLLGGCVVVGVVLVGTPSGERISLHGPQGLALMVMALLSFLWIAGRVMPVALARPVVTVDYLAEANRLMRPADYDPNRNAFLFYEQLGDRWTTMDAVQRTWRLWPADLDAADANSVREWAPVNRPLLPLLKEAAQCPYFWYEAKSKEGALAAVDMPDVENLAKICWGSVLLAKFEATEGNVLRAFEILTDLHMMGVHLSKGPTLVDQLVGLACCEAVYSAGLSILDRCPADAASLNTTLRAVRDRLPLVQVPRFSEAERLHGYDLIQRTFTDDGEGDGILALSPYYARARAGTHGMSYLGALRICLSHPGRKDTVSLHDTYFAKIRAAASETPWQLHVRKTSCEAITNQLLTGNCFLWNDVGLGSMKDCVQLNWHTRAAGNAFVTILAILAYKTQKGGLPASLDDLVKERYLGSVPIDPYSGGPLVYKVTGSNFTLYSLGENFTDDAGLPATWEESRTKGDLVFWPIQPNRPVPAQ